jgi:hypothetical protein
MMLPFSSAKALARIYPDCYAIDIGQIAEKWKQTLDAAKIPFMFLCFHHLRL